MSAAFSKCQRCGCPARGKAGSPDARLLKHATAGVCVDCGVVLFLQRVGNMHGGIERLLPPGFDVRQAFSLPHVQEQFAAVMKAGHADARPDEINWERVIELWDLQPPAKSTLF